MQTIPSTHLRKHVNDGAADAYSHALFKQKEFSMSHLHVKVKPAPSNSQAGAWDLK